MKRKRISLAKLSKKISCTSTQLLADFDESFFYSADFLFWQVYSVYLSISIVVKFSPGIILFGGSIYKYINRYIEGKLITSPQAHHHNLQCKLKNGFTCSHSTSSSTQLDGKDCRIGMVSVLQAIDDRNLRWKVWTSDWWWRVPVTKWGSDTN